MLGKHHIFIVVEEFYYGVEECWRNGLKKEPFGFMDLGCGIIYNMYLQSLHTLFWHFGVIITVKASQAPLISTGN